MTFSSHSNTGNDKEILNIDRIKIEEATKRTKHRKVPGVDDITVEEPEAATIGSGAEVLLRLFRKIWERSDSHRM